MHASIPRALYLVGVTEIQRIARRSSSSLYVFHVRKFDKSVRRGPSFDSALAPPGDSSLDQNPNQYIRQPVENKEPLKKARVGANWLQHDEYNERRDAPHVKHWSVHNNPLCYYRVILR